MSEIKLAEPVRKLLKEKEAEIKELTEKVKSLESELEKSKEGPTKAAGEKTKVRLEDLVFAYILGAGGEINVARCAEDLGAKEERVKGAVDKLIESGRISR